MLRNITRFLALLHGTYPGRIEVMRLIWRFEFAETWPVLGRSYYVVTVVAVALACVIAAAVDAQRTCYPDKCFPDEIESLFREYLTQLPDMVFQGLDVHCDRTRCVAVFVPTEQAQGLAPEHLLPLYDKGWNIVSFGTGASFDPATGEQTAYVEISTRSNTLYRPL